MVPHLHLHLPRKWQVLQNSAQICVKKIKCFVKRNLSKFLFLLICYWLKSVARLLYPLYLPVDNTRISGPHSKVFNIVRKSHWQQLAVYKSDISIIVPSGSSQKTFYDAALFANHGHIAALLKHFIREWFRTCAMITPLCPNNEFRTETCFVNGFRLLQSILYAFVAYKAVFKWTRVEWYWTGTCVMDQAQYGFTMCYTLNTTNYFDLLLFYQLGSVTHTINTPSIVPLLNLGEKYVHYTINTYIYIYQML